MVISRCPSNWSLILKLDIFRVFGPKMAQKSSLKWAWLKNNFDLLSTKEWKGVSYNKYQVSCLVFHNKPWNSTSEAAYVTTSQCHCLRGLCQGFQLIPLNQSLQVISGSPEHMKLSPDNAFGGSVYRWKAATVLSFTRKPPSNHVKRVFTTNLNTTMGFHIEAWNMPKLVLKLKNI